MPQPQSKVSAPPEPPPTKAPESRFIGPFEAALRHPLLVALPLVLLIGAGLAIGLVRKPVYTAQANINVGRVDVPAYTLEGVIEGNATLAASYARAGDAPAVLDSAARAGGISPDEARARLDVSPVIGTTVVLVEGTGPTTSAAVKLSNGGADALISYIQLLNNEQQVTGLLPQYRAALAQVAQARARLARLKATKPPDPGSTQQAQLDLQTAQLQVQSYSDEYLNQGAIPAPNDLQLIAPAVRATSDFTSALERLLLAGLAAGLVVGVLLALASANAWMMNSARRAD